jgi:hypothetical protein
MPIYSAGRREFPNVDFVEFLECANTRVGPQIAPALGKYDGVITSQKPQRNKVRLIKSS